LPARAACFRAKACDRLPPPRTRGYRGLRRSGRADMVAAR